MHVWKIDGEEGCSAVRIASFGAGIRGLKGRAEGESHQAKCMGVRVGFHLVRIE